MDGLVIKRRRNGRGHMLDASLARLDPFPTTEITVSKHRQKLEQHPSAEPTSITEVGELSEEQLNQISGGFSNAEHGATYAKVSLGLRKSSGGSSGGML
jgi:bacteriocin-like protein